MRIQGVRHLQPAYRFIRAEDVHECVVVAWFIHDIVGIKTEAFQRGDCLGEMVVNRASQRDGIFFQCRDAFG